MTARAILYAFLSAVLFGISTPAAKAFLGSTDPTVLAGLLYCGAEVGVALIRRFVRPMLSPPGIGEMTLRHSDLPWLSGAIIAGGVVGPVLLLVGLTRTDAATASLLLTLEGVATVLMAWFLFHENFDRRVVLGMACLLAGVAVLSWSGQPTLSDPLFYVRMLLVALAIYLVVKIRTEVLRMPQGDKPAAKTAIWRRAKILAGLSLACWMGVIAAGRFLAYTHTWLRVGLPAGF